jgi:hypothetical protein
MALGGVAEPQWFCVRTAVNAEYSVCLGLAESKFRPYLPQYAGRRHRYGRDETVIRPLFPCYLFALFDPDDGERWATLPHGGVRGVRNVLIAPSGRLRLTRPGEIERLQALGRAGDGVICAGLPGMGPIQPAEIERGAKVQPLDGAWVNWMGVCEWSEGQRLGVLMSLFGRDQVVIMDRASVRVV